MPTPQPRTKKYKRKPGHPVKLIPHSQEMDKLGEQEIAKSRQAVKNKLNQWYDRQVYYVSKPTESAVSKAFSKAKVSILRLCNGGKKTIKDVMKLKVKKKNQE